MRKTRLTYQLTKDVFNKNPISNQTNIKHYNSVIKPNTLYAAKYVFLINIRNLEQIYKMERKILRNI